MSEKPHTVEIAGESVTVAEPDRRFATRENSRYPVSRRYEDVYVPEENLWYRIQSLTELERADWEEATDDGDGVVDPRRAKAELIVRVCVNACGAPIYTPDDADWIAQKDWAVVGRLYREALRHCNCEPGQPEALAKNSKRIGAVTSR